LTDPKICWLSETAVVLDVPGAARLEVQRRIWWLAARCRSLAGVREVVPGMNNLTVDLDPQAPELDQLPERLRAEWLQSTGARHRPHLVEIPVRYGGEGGPDLGAVARHTGLTAAEVVRRHAGAVYTVFFLGFQPGFAYLGGLDPRLATPRRAEPRLAVPAGSVGIGGEQTGVYPSSSPGGWQLIGRTSLPLFDAASEAPTLLLPGDTVRFVAIGEGPSSGS
jgi:KipI family sensor histidine kinase inhibitor